MEANIVLAFVLLSYLLFKQFCGRLFICSQNIRINFYDSYFSRIHLQKKVSKKLHVQKNPQTQLGRLHQIPLASENNLSMKLKILGESTSFADVLQNRSS